MLDVEPTDQHGRAEVSGQSGRGMSFHRHWGDTADLLTPLSHCIIDIRIT